jgi:uncharacterized protein YjiS (DUF1127 family)
VILSRTVRVWRDYRTGVRELSRLSDAELSDIGLTRSAIHWTAWQTSGGDAAGKPATPASNAEAPEDER